MLRIILRTVLLVALLVVEVLSLNLPSRVSASFSEDQSFQLIHPKGASSGDYWAIHYAAEAGGELDLGDMKVTSDGGTIIVGTHAPLLSTVGNIWIMKLAGNGVVSWSKEILGVDNASAVAVEEVTGGGYVVGGNTYEHEGDGDAFLASLSADGTVLWTKRYSNDDRPDSFIKIEAASDGNLFVVRRLQDQLLKITPDGEILWQVSLILHAVESVQATSDGGVVLGGMTEVNWAGDPWIARVNAQGDVLWERKYWAGAGDRVLWQAKETSNGSFIIVGSYYEENSKVWVANLSHNGTVLWERLYDNSRDDYAMAVFEGQNNNIVVLANDAVYGDTRYSLFSLDGSGDLQWQRLYPNLRGGFTGTTRGNLNPLQATDDGFVMAGNYDDEILVYKVDESGLIQGCNLILDNDFTQEAIPHTTVEAVTTTTVSYSTQISGEPFSAQNVFIERDIQCEPPNITPYLQSSPPGAMIYTASRN